MTPTHYIQFGTLGGRKRESFTPRGASLLPVQVTNAL
jgi:hypothetical protein